MLLARAIQKIQFSTYQFPYNFQGYQPVSNPKTQIIAQEIFGKDVNEGFLFAYKGILESFVANQDRDDYIKENCDSALASSLITGLDHFIFKKKKISLETIPISEEAVYDRFQLHFFYDGDKSYMDQTAKTITQIDDRIEVHLHQPTIKLLAQGQVPRPVCTIGVYLKSDTLFQAEGNITDPNASHYVTFQTVMKGSINVADQQFKVLEIIKKGIDRNAQTKFIRQLLTGDYSWRISELDHFRKQ